MNNHRKNYSEIATTAQWSFPLNMLFRAVTGISIFCAMMTVSPPLAIIATMFVTPALVRTTLVLDRYEKERYTIDWPLRIYTFIVSLFYTAATFAIGACVFALICTICGFGGLFFSIMVRSQDQAGNAIVVGVLIGMIWGGFGGVLTMTYLAIKTWIPLELKGWPSQTFPQKISSET